MKVTVSGTTMACAIAGSGVPDEEHWPAPVPRRIGVGVQWIYTCTPKMAELIASHLEDLGETWRGCGDDPEMGRDSRACLRDAARIRQQLIESGGLPCIYCGEKLTAELVRDEPCPGDEKYNNMGEKHVPDTEGVYFS